MKILHKPMNSTRILEKSGKSLKIRCSRSERSERRSVLHSEHIHGHTKTCTAGQVDTDMHSTTSHRSYKTLKYVAICPGGQADIEARSTSSNISYKTQIFVALPVHLLRQVPEKLKKPLKKPYILRKLRSP